jgi:hypothetical protein
VSFGFHYVAKSSGPARGRLFLFLPDIQAHPESWRNGVQRRTIVDTLSALNFETGAGE